MNTLKCILGWVFLLPVLVVMFAFSYGYPITATICERIREGVLAGWRWVSDRVLRFFRWLYSFL